MKADAWAKKILADVRSYHGDASAMKKALGFLIQGKKEDAEAELEAAGMERLKADNDRRLGATALAAVREEHAMYLESQAKRLGEQVKALDAILRKKK